jgi:hypothetical protein
MTAGYNRARIKDFARPKQRRPEKRTSVEKVEGAEQATGNGYSGEKDVGPFGTRQSRRLQSRRGTQSRRSSGTLTLGRRRRRRDIVLGESVSEINLGHIFRGLN